MKKTIKGFVLGLIVATMLMSTVLGAGVKKTIEVAFNSINLTVNGEKVNADTILYEGKTYVPLRAAGEMLGKYVGWDKATNTASIDDNKKDEGVKKEDNVNEFNNVTKENILGKWQDIGYYDRAGMYIKEDESFFELTFLSDGIHYYTMSFPNEQIKLTSKYKYEVVANKVILVDTKNEYDPVDPIEIKISQDENTLHYYVGTGVIQVYERFK